MKLILKEIETTVLIRGLDSRGMLTNYINRLGGILVNAKILVREEGRTVCVVCKCSLSLGKNHQREYYIFQLNLSAPQIQNAQTILHVLRRNAKIHASQAIVELMLNVGLSSTVPRVFVIQVSSVTPIVSAKSVRHTYILFYGTK